MNHQENDREKTVSRPFALLYRYNNLYSAQSRDVRNLKRNQIKLSEKKKNEYFYVKASVAKSLLRFRRRGRCYPHNTNIVNDGEHNTISH